MKRFLLISALILAAFNSSAQHETEPAQSVFDVWGIDYYSAIRYNLLERDRDEYFKVRYFVLPSFRKEYFLGLQSKDGEHTLIYREPEGTQSIWSSGRFHDLQTRQTDYTVEVKEIKRKISPESADLMIRLSESLVLNTRFTRWNGVVGFDGESYYFSVSDGDYKTIGTRSPPEGSDSREAVKIFEEITDIVKKRSRTIEFNSDLTSRITGLIEKFDPVPPEPSIEDFMKDFQMEIDSVAIKNPHLTKEYGEQLFREHLNLVTELFSDPNSFHIDSLLVFEQSKGSEDVTRGHMWTLGKTVYPNKNKHKFNIPIGFRRFEAPYIDGRVDYFSTQKLDRVKIVAYNWAQFRQEVNKGQTRIEDVNSVFIEKIEFIIDTLNEVFGGPFSYSDDGKIKAYWKNDKGVYASLFKFSNYNEIRLRVYIE